MGLFLASFTFYLMMVSPSVTTGDSGEFMTTASVLGLAHSPSYPLYSLVVKCFMELIPWGGRPFIVNVSSAFLSGLTLMVIFFVSRRLDISRFNALLISALFGLTHSFWMNSLVTEVFPLNTLLAAILIYIFINAQKSETPEAFLRSSLQFMFLLGLSCGNHQTIIFFLAPFAIFYFYRLSGRGASVKVLLCGFSFILGFSVYLFLPIRAVKSPPLNWGQPTTAAKFYRSVARKDYGSFTLALGGQPARNFKNTFIHITKFVKQTNKETSFMGGLMFLGLIAGFFWNRRLFGLMILLFLISGPGFILLGNLPFTAQSEGIMGRFYILPVLILTLGWIGWAKIFPRVFGLGGPVLLTILLFSGISQASSHRNNFMVLDYGRSMLRLIPPNSTLFLDGGDDAFYSLAMLSYVNGSRPDLKIYDRGGLVFENPYGDDFRRIGKILKNARRTTVEKSFLKKGRVFYSTMDKNALPGAALNQIGFLYEADQATVEADVWERLHFRGVYPLVVNDFRNRALAGFFPFMRGQNYLEKGNIDEALKNFKRAQTMSPDVDWLNTNLNFQYSHEGFNALMRGDFKGAEKIYTQWIQFQPDSQQAYSNLGVVYEKLGQYANARAQYETAMNLFPDADDPVYNLAVLEWQNGNWSKVSAYLEETLKRNPHHLNAKKYLNQVKEKLNRG